MSRPERILKVLNEVPSIRWPLVVLLAEDPNQTVAELAEKSGKSISWLSRHLKVLEQEGIVKAHDDALNPKRGRVYALNVEMALVEQLDGFAKWRESVLRASGERLATQRKGIAGSDLGEFEILRHVAMRKQKPLPLLRTSLDLTTGDGHRRVGQVFALIPAIADIGLADGKVRRQDWEPFGEAIVFVDQRQFMQMLQLLTDIGYLDTKLLLTLNQNVDHIEDSGR